MSDSDSNVSKLNGSSGFISYEESKSEGWSGWSSENSVDYSTQNKRNNRKLLKRRNQSSAHSKIFQNVHQAENHAVLERTPPEGMENESTTKPSGDNASSPLYHVTSSGLRATFSDEAVRTVNYYKQFGDFWNVFPKTDYVYSRHSKWYGSEVAPGIPRIPNMCRPTYRGRYDNPKRFYSRLLNTGYSEHEDETWVFRIRRIVRTSLTTTVTTFTKVAKTIASPAVTAATSVVSTASSVASSAAATVSSVASTVSSASATVSSAATTVSSAASTVSSWISEALSSLSASFVSRTSDNGNLSSGNLRSFLLLLLLLIVPLLYVGFSGIDPPPPYVPSFIDDLSLDSVHSTVTWVWSPFARLWGGTLWFSSLLLSSILMIPTLFVEAVAPIFGFFQYYNATSTLGRTSIPVDTLQSSPSSSMTSEELNNLKLWVTDMVATRIKDLKDELGADHKQTDAQKGMLDTFVLIQNKIKELEGADKTSLKKVGQLEEGYMENQRIIKQLLDTLNREKQIQLETLAANAGKKEIEAPDTTVISAVIRNDVIRIVQHLLEEYHADRTGKPDYALGSNGATIASIRCTRPFNKRSAEYVLWGIRYWEHVNTPDIILKPGFMPGECWAFEGANGYVAIQLSMPIYVSGFSLEHTPKELTPLGHIESAPRKFSVWGLLSLEDKEEEFLGRFEFQDNGKSLQTFDAIVLDKPFQIVELRIESNHGHLEYTCLYRFRVHGRPAF